MSRNLSRNLSRTGWPALRGALLVSLICSVAACIAQQAPPTEVPPTQLVTVIWTTPTAAPTGIPAPTPTFTPWPYPWTDESAVMSGLCFESVYDAAGQTFILRSAEDLIRFYDLADHSELCRQPVTRYAFDFGGGRILAGLWSRGTGCTAHHEIDNARRDDSARTLFIFLRLVVEGNCNYTLVRPFWIGLSDFTDYQIQFVVE